MPTENSNNNKQIIIKIIYFCRKRIIVHRKCVCMCAFICESVNVHVDMYMCVRTVLVFILMLTSILTLKWKTIHNIHPHQPTNQPTIQAITTTTATATTILQATATEHQSPKKSISFSCCHRRLQPAAVDG